MNSVLGKLGKKVKQGFLRSLIKTVHVFSIFFVLQFASMSTSALQIPIK